jgi:hypothetical protein
MIDNINRHISIMKEKKQNERRFEISSKSNRLLSSPQDSDGLCLYLSKVGRLPSNSIRFFHICTFEINRKISIIQIQIKNIVYILGKYNSKA